MYALLQVPLIAESWLNINNLNVVGVTGTALGIVGRVKLTVSLHKKVNPFRDHCYVSKTFALPVDGILGLNAMKDLRITIIPENTRSCIKDDASRG